MQQSVKCILALLFVSTMVLQISYVYADTATNTGAETDTDVGTDTDEGTDTKTSIWTRVKNLDCTKSNIKLHMQIDDFLDRIISDILKKLEPVFKDTDDNVEKFFARLPDMLRLLPDIRDRVSGIICRFQNEQLTSNDYENENEDESEDETENESEDESENESEDSPTPTSTTTHSSKYTNTNISTLVYPNSTIPTIYNTISNIKSSQTSTSTNVEYSTTTPDSTTTTADSTTTTELNIETTSSEILQTTQKTQISDNQQITISPIESMNISIVYNNTAEKENMLGNTGVDANTKSNSIIAPAVGTVVGIVVFALAMMIIRSRLNSSNDVKFQKTDSFANSVYDKNIKFTNVGTSSVNNSNDYNNIYEEPDAQYETPVPYMNRNLITNIYDNNNDNYGNLDGSSEPVYDLGSSQVASEPVYDLGSSQVASEPVYDLGSTPPVNEPVYDLGSSTDN